MRYKRGTKKYFMKIFGAAALGAPACYLILESLADSFL